MAEDELKQSSEETLSDRLLGVGEAALAVGAGAALFYRSGGAKYLSGGLERTSRFLSRAHSEITSRSVSDWNPNEMRSVADNLKRAWREIDDDVKSRSIGLRTDDHRTLFGLLGTIKQIRENPNEKLTEMYNREKLVAPTLDHYTQNYSVGTELSDRNMENFIRGLATKLDNKVSVEKYMDDSNLSAAERDVAEQLTEHMKMLNTSAERKTFKSENQKILDQVADVASQLDEWEKVYGTANNPSKTRSGVDRILNDGAATIGDLLENADKIQESRTFYKNGRDHRFEDTINSLTKMREEFRAISAEHEQRFLALTPDAAALRKGKDGSVYSFKAASKVIDSALDFAAGTLPGKILKLRDMQYMGKAPAIQYVGKGDYDPILAALAENGRSGSPIKGSYFRIMDKVYRSTEEGLEHVEGADNTYLISGSFGTMPKLLKQMMGDNSFRRSNNVLGRILDINQDGEETILKQHLSRFRKFADDDWRGNELNRLINPTEAQQVAHDLAANLRDNDYAVRYLGRADTLNTLFGKNTYELDSEAIRKMMPHAKGEAAELLRKLMEPDNEKLISSIMTPSGSSIGRTDRWLNKDLISLLHEYVTKTKKTVDSITLKTDRTMFDGQGKETADFYDILRMELGKEAFLKHAMAESDTAGTRNHAAILDLVEKSGLIGKEKNEAKRLGYWAAFQDITGVTGRQDYSRSGSSVRMWNTINRTERLLDTANKDKFHEDFRATVKDVINERISSIEKFSGIDESVAKGVYYGDAIHMQKAVSILDVIRSLNDAQKFKATGSKFVKQFFAGRNDPHNITTATMYPYFALARLSDEMNKVGLGFSRQSMGSVGELAKNIMLKRIAPVGIGVTYLEWMDDTVQEITGTSLTSSFANGLGNIDLAYRRVSDATGLTGFLKDEKDLSPMMQYYHGKDAYQDYDERKKYYENGYDPVRKGRYWTFGGVNEFRGGQIAYWEPNFVRRANSDYADKSLYDGYWDKWSHSLLPTPTNPFSPIAALVDPYWLENKHSEDRPYPVSGSMFSEGTPWGVVLNPTIGEMIKPKRLLHTDRMKDGVDTKALIYRMNKEVQAKALNEDNQNLIVIKGGQMEAMQFTAYNAPTMDERIYTSQFTGNRQQGAIQADYGVYDGGIDPNEYADQSGTGGMSMQMQGSAAPTNTELSTTEKLQIDAATGGTLGQIATGFVKHINPVVDIGHLNRNIAMRAQLKKTEGIMTPEKIVNLQVSQGMSLLNNAETIDELMHMSTGNDMIKEAALSARLITGIYGYGANRAFGFGENSGKKMATAADIDSPFRTFWDSGFAGFSLFGTGEVMEISRRFMPDFKRGSRINPLMNTMPDWLPERYRFGDPFTAVPKGEMRMPGEGYESLNELHPDQFGEYGAFDRFKILADIAPYSPEYKVWKQIAQKTVMDPKLKEEMKSIKERASQQGKQHEFYDYKFLGRDLDYQSVTVTEVLERGKFKIYGSDAIYKLAGVKLKSSKDGASTQEILNQYIHAGQALTIAVDSNEHYRSNNDTDHSVNAAVFIDGENLSTKLLEEGIAEKRKGDTSSAAVLGKYTQFQRMRGQVYEFFAHLDLPLIHDRWMRVRSPLESYRAEQVYGTPYQTWSAPIDTFLKPAYERAISDHVAVAVGEIASYAFRISENISGIGPNQRKLISGAYMLANRGAFMGGTLGYLLKPDGGKTMRIGAKLGSLAMTAGHLYTGLDDPFESAIGFGHIAYEIAEYTKHSRIKSVAIGAAVGLALYGESNSALSPKGEWIPERTRKKWELQEYFDRLSYIKYMGLYHKAAEKALDDEDVDIEKIITKQENDAVKNKEIKEELMAAKSKLATLPESSDMRKHLSEVINKKLEALSASQVVLRGGRWTQAAMLYKQAADATMYGMKDDVTWANLIRALPKTDREYFMEFIKERDPDKRDDILKVASPQMQRALKKAWGMNQDPMEDNDSYFTKHNLPGFSWSGWRPDVDLNDVQVKTIENEGMQLTDFGYYESQLRDPDVINAPNLSPQGQQDPLTLQANLQATLRGFGLMGVDVSVQPAPMSGVQVVANVARIVEYNIESAAKDVFRLL